MFHKRENNVEIPRKTIKHPRVSLEGVIIPTTYLFSSLVSVGNCCAQQAQQATAAVKAVLSEQDTRSHACRCVHIARKRIAHR